LNPPETTEPAPKAEAAPPEVKPEPEKPLFTLPETVGLPKEAVTSLEGAMKKALNAEGKLVLDPQQAVDFFVENALGPWGEAWQQQVKQTSDTNEAACKRAFSPEELAAAETTVGWLNDRFDSSFRENFARRQLNDPTFVRLLNLIHDAYIAEDQFPAPGSRPVERDARPLLERAQDRLYGKTQ